ncbi:hypothetical protein L0P54_07575 [Anaerosalibacter bizertensis]|uniref:Poly-beta-1,6-N-acetyl-D-glucosamine biosynthesis protein PgaD n=1 Tax=Anaerosalibacter bizertensis TaxID=932217 RepID=A0A9Q4AD21_9FIRM|nr:hypothetical protein [Anaerosalibacter bizertensis]MBV1820187.1 hypothetical protein [Bacteroidales bacterium MSK.15.36]MCB5560458.1 hypothetical protein [Anaerosalibacter bizertensis]MCG4565482.1 hypothetical protein [Anaerosalibacter bizertensis]MCG4582845.1 hypothetical protein [Anaerosalibacter bizertensis]MCG4584049.1 hypothetical protein [Anaerosalibacter bizertensis]
MDKSRQRTKDFKLNQSFIIKSKKSWWREGIVILFTSIVWVYCITVIYFFIDAIFSINNEYPRLFKVSFKMTNFDIQGFFKIAVVLLVTIYIMLLVWIFYNKKRFGSLTRRKYPGITTKEDLMDLDMIDEDIYEILQEEKVVVFETNPIRDRED